MRISLSLTLCSCKYLYEVCEIVLNKLNSRRTRTMPRRYKVSFWSRALYNKQHTDTEYLIGMYNDVQQVA